VLVVGSQYSTTTIDLLRHGECEDGSCYRGSTDVALSEIGYQQMLLSAGCIVPIYDSLWTRIISSPLQRCAVFAADLAQQKKIPITVDAAFQELHFGDWEGQAIDHIWQTQQVAVESWFADPVNFPPPNGEKADVFFLRVKQALLNCISTAGDEDLLLVVHGGVIRALLAHCLSMSLADMNRFDVPYGCLSRIQVSYDHDNDQCFYRLIAHNITAIKGKKI
jgi:broad specificity phosphatase PhoE